MLDTFRSVGLGYLTLGQPSTTFSGGEAQRARLASELAAPTAQHTLYLLDEPTSGLHPADVVCLMRHLRKLVDTGHSVVVIEHNPDVICSSDWILDLGPDSADNGGEIVYSGPTKVASLDDSPFSKPWGQELNKKNGERYSRSPFVWGVFFGGRVQDSRNHRFHSDQDESCLIQSDKRTHPTSFSQQCNLFAFILGRSMTCPNLSQTNFALSAASNFTLSFCTSHEAKKSCIAENTRSMMLAEDTNDDHKSQSETLPST